MSSFALPNSSPECTVNLTDDLSKDQLLGFKPFKEWISTLQHSLSLQQNKDHTFHTAPYKLRSISIQSVDFFGGGSKIGFIKLKADISNDNNEKLPGSVFLRGGSVGMMIILQPDDVPGNTEKDKHVLLTIQPRIPAGSLALAELPAGMLSDQGSFAGGAANEIHEETGLEVREDELINMSELALPGPDEESNKAGEKLQRATYPSAGGSDEYIPIFLHQRRVKRETLKEWEGKLTGVREHGEKITLKLVPLEELWREGGRDAKAMIGWALYEGLRREGKI